jgi:hypothetical protein
LKASYFSLSFLAFLLLESKPGMFCLKLDCFISFELGTLVLEIFNASKKPSFFLSSVEKAVVPSVSLLTPSDGKVLSSELSEP